MEDTVVADQSPSLYDVNGRRIERGSVIEKVEANFNGDRSRGVVVRVYEEGDKAPWYKPIGVGDFEVSQSAQTSTFSCKGGTWRHVPDEDLSYRDRYRGYLASERPDDESELSLIHI